MTLQVNHSFLSTVPDGPDSTLVKPSDWNNRHSVTGTADASQLNANVVQVVTNDTNVTGAIAAQNLTLGWTGTLAAARLNANVVQSVVNDTNVTGSISAQSLTLGWTGGLAYSRLASSAQGWTNTRLAKTANYAVANADKGSTIALGGASFFTLTFNAASGYDANFAVVVVNEDTGRGKTIACNGLSNFILWPLQSVIIFNQNNVWTVYGKSRWILTAAITLYIDPINGSNSNDGLAAGSGNALLTPNQAASVIANSLDTNQWSVTVQYAAGTYTDQNFVAKGYVGNGDIILQGDTVTPTNVKMVQTASFAPFQFVSTTGAPGHYTVQGFYMTSTLAGTFGIYAQGSGVYVKWNHNNFGSFPSGSHTGGQYLAICDSGGSNTISGGANQHCNAVDGMVVHFTTGVDTFANPTVTITIASPGVVTLANHGFTANMPIAFATTGALPTGLTAGTIYYVVGASITTNTFQVSTAPSGGAINTSGTQSGTQSVMPAFATDVLDTHGGGTTLGTVNTNWSGSAAGKRYTASLLSLIDTGGTSTSLPGNVAGSPVAGTLAGDGAYVN